MIPVQTLPPNPPPMPPTPPGVPPATGAVAASAPPPTGGAPAMQGPAPGTPPSGPGTPPPGAPPSPESGPPGATPSPASAAGDESGASGGPGASDETPIRPRLIPGTDDQTGNVAASPSEQRDLQQVLVKAGEMIHKSASRDRVLNSLHQPGNNPDGTPITVAQAVGRTAAQILMTIDDQKQAVTKVPISPEVMREAARYVVPELMHIGVSSGIFPIKPPPDVNAKGGDNDEDGPGRGSDPYNKEMRMAMLEATKVYGEAQLRSPNAAQLTQNAQNEWAQNISREVQQGQADPKYMAMLKAKQNAAAGGGPSPPPALIDTQSQGGGANS